MVHMVVRAGVDIHFDFFRREKHRHAPVEVDAGSSIRIGATVGEVEVGRNQRSFVRFEDKSVLPQPSDADRVLRHRESADVGH